MITFKEQCEVYHERYKLSASEVKENVKADNDMRKLLNEKWFTKDDYRDYLDRMEKLGSE